MKVLELDSEKIYRRIFRSICVIGRPFGGLRPWRIYHQLAGLAYKAPEYAIYKDCRGLQMLLTPTSHIDLHIIGFGEYEPALQSYIQKNIKDGMVCMDIGANIGAVALHLGYRAGLSGRIYAFEPVGCYHLRLLENIRLNNLSDVIYP